MTDRAPKDNLWHVTDYDGSIQVVITTTCEAMADVVIFSHMHDGKRVVDAAFPNYRSVRLGVIPLTPDDS
jgi:hypothetical protein